MIAIGQLAIALAVVGWYFTREKEKISNATVLWAFHTTCRYHLGTVAFGSLIIALVKTARAVVAYLQVKPFYQTQTLLSNTNPFIKHKPFYQTQTLLSNTNPIIKHKPLLSNTNPIIKHIFILRKRTERNPWTHPVTTSY